MLLKIIPYTDGDKHHAFKLVDTDNGKTKLELAADSDKNFAIWTDLFKKVLVCGDAEKAQDILNALSTSAENDVPRHSTSDEERIDIDKLIAVADSLIEKSSGDTGGMWCLLK